MTTRWRTSCSSGWFHGTSDGGVAFRAVVEDALRLNEPFDCTISVNGGSVTFYELAVTH